MSNGKNHNCYVCVPFERWRGAYIILSDLYIKLYNTIQNKRFKYGKWHFLSLVREIPVKLLDDHIIQNLIIMRYSMHLVLIACGGRNLNSCKQCYCGSSDLMQVTLIITTSIHNRPLKNDEPFSQGCIGIISIKEAMEFIY